MTTPAPDQFDDKMERALGLRRALDELTANGVNLRALADEGRLLHPTDPDSRVIVLHFDRSVLARKFQEAVRIPFIARRIERAMREHYGDRWTFAVSVGGKECVVTSVRPDLWITAEEIVNEIEVRELDALWTAPEPGAIDGDPLVAQELSIWGLRSSEKEGGCGHIALDIIADPSGITISGGYDVFAWRGHRVTDLARFLEDNESLTCQQCEAIIPRAALRKQNIEGEIIPW